MHFFCFAFLDRAAARPYIHRRWLHRDQYQISLADGNQRIGHGVRGGIDQNKVDLVFEATDFFGQAPALQLNMFDGVGITQLFLAYGVPQRQRSLGVDVDGGDARPGAYQPNGQLGGQRSFTGPPFLLRNGNDFAAHSAPIRGDFV